MVRQSFIYGAIILLITNFFNRVVGFVYQILMIRLIGPEGVGLFNMVYPIYVLVLVAATAGIPVAIAKMVAEEVAKNNLAGAYRVFRISFLYIFTLSIFFTVVLLVGAPLLKKYVFPNPKVYYCFLSLIPGIIIVSLCSSFRGFFQGLQQMVPTAVTQVTEQLIRVVAGLSIAYFLLPQGVEYAAIGISLGVILGEFTGFLLMLIIYFSSRPQVQQPYNPLKSFIGQETARIFSLAVPVTLTRLVATGFMSVDAILIPRRLYAAGLSLSEATAAYGELIGIAMSLVLTPGIITFALATALVPAVSDAIAIKNYSLVRSRVSESLRLTMLAGMPATLLLLIIPEQICDLFFGYPRAGTIMRALALGGPFLYFSQTATAILQGLGKAEKPLKNLLIGSVVKVVGVYYLTVIPTLGIVGAAYALSFSYAVSALLNYRDLRILTGVKLQLAEWLIKPLFASICMVLVIINICSVLTILIGTGKVCTIISLLFGIPVYMIIMFIIGGIKSHDLERFKSLLKIK